MKKVQQLIGLRTGHKVRLAWTVTL